MSCLLNPFFQRSQSVGNELSDADVLPSHDRLQENATFHSDISPPTTVATLGASQPPAVVGTVNLLDWDDAPNASTQQSGTNQNWLKDAANALSPQVFQEKWLGLPESVNTRISGLRGVSFSIQAIEDILRSNKVSRPRYSPLSCF